MIGILTFHRGPNYGGFLQAWHLRKSISSLGHRVTVINYQNPIHAASERLPHSGFSLREIRSLAHKYLKARPFAKVVAELSDQPFTTEPDEVDWERFSKVVVGSDVVWDFCNPSFGHDPAFFGALPAQAQTPFVSYAASCGKTAATSSLPEYVERGLKRFSTHLVRDQNTVELVHRVTGREAPLVVDPTWLQEDPIPKRRYAPSQPYVLLYGGGLDSARAKVLRDYCDYRKLKLFSASTPCKAADKVFRSMDPFDWVDLFRHAEAVVTSTLHGVLYTIKYHKPLLLMNNEQTANKARTVISRCGLEASVVTPGMAFDEETLHERLATANAAQPDSRWIAASLEALASSLD